MHPFIPYTPLIMEAANVATGSESRQDPEEELMTYQSGSINQGAAKKAEPRLSPSSNERSRDNE